MTDTVKFRFVGDVYKMRLTPDDTVVICFRERLSHVQRERIVDQLQRYFPDNRCIVLDGGTTLAVASPNA